MKKHYLPNCTFTSLCIRTPLVFLGMLISCSTYAQAWNIVGSAGFSSSDEGNLSLAVDGSGTPYVFYHDGTGGSDPASVMKYNGSNWVFVGVRFFTPTYPETSNQSIAVNSSGKPYVVFADGSNSSQAMVMSFNDTGWAIVGNRDFSAGGGIYNPTIAIDGSGTPYVAYSDNFYNQKITVMKYNGSSWVNVGSPGFSASGVYGIVSVVSLAIDGSGTPYVAFKDSATNKATVMKYNGTNWVALGSVGFSPGIINYLEMAVTGGGTPYVVFDDAGFSSRATVMQYSGSSWTVVGTEGFSAGQVAYPFIALDAGGTPYVGYQDQSTTGNKASVMKFEFGTWSNFGNADFSAGMTTNTCLATGGNNIFVAFRDGTVSNSATVMSPDAWAGVKNTPGAASSVSLFPNPNNGSFTLKVPSVANDDARIFISNTLGQRIKEMTIATNTETEIQLNIPPGMYFINAATESENTSMKIIVE